MKATFENSVDVLVKAYLNDTLEHGLCSMCAVGNLLGGNSDWSYVFQTDSSKRMQYVAAPNTILPFFMQIDTAVKFLRAMDAIDKSGYSQDQLMRIEYAFEMAPGKFNGRDTHMFNGLMAVVDVLAEIHGVDLTVKENAIGQFKEVQLQKL